MPTILNRIADASLVRRLDRLLGHPLLLFRVRRRARRQIRAALGRAATPVLVYQMGKVASKSIVATLAPYPEIAVFFAHYLVRQRLRERCARARRDGRWQQCVSIAEWGVTHELLFGSDREIKIVTLVREPIGRNISAFFQGLDRWTRVTDAHINVPMVSLIETFHRDFLHGWPLAWFDEEFRAVTGIDVYGRPFPAVAGHQRISQGRFDVLIMRHDLADSIKGQCLSEFLGIPGIEIVQDNRAEDKTYFDRYRAFQAAVRLSPAYVEEMLGSQYAQHFFPPDELDRLRSKWLAGGRESPARATAGGFPGGTMAGGS